VRLWFQYIEVVTFTFSIDITTLPAREIITEMEHQFIQMHNFLERCIVALCTLSLLVYVLQSLAAEKYIALYVTLFKKVPLFFLGD